MLNWCAHDELLNRKQCSAHLIRPSWHRDQGCPVSSQEDNEEEWKENQVLPHLLLCLQYHRAPDQGNPGFMEISCIQRLVFDLYRTRVLTLLGWLGHIWKRKRNVLQYPYWWLWIDWSTDCVLKTRQAKCITVIKEDVGENKVLMLLSGGVDSTICT